MKLKYIIFTIVLSSFSLQYINAQDCLKKRFCDREDFEDYDYRSQSYGAYLAPGDTSRVNFVVYSKQDFRVLVCGEGNLGDVQFRIIKPVREHVREIKTINEEEIIEYEMDEWGSELLDDDGNPVIKSKEVLRDTVWESKVEKKEIIIYDSKKSDETYWEQKDITKTSRMFVEVIVPPGDPDNAGCVAIMIGRKFSRSRSFMKKY